MTITAQVPRSGPFTGNGSTVAFTYGFLLDADTELVVVVRNTATNVIADKTLTTDYSVAGVGTVAGGTVTFVTAPTANEQVVFLRSVPLVQDLDLQNRGVVSPELLEDQLDELTRITQDHGEALARAVLADAFGVINQDQLVLYISDLGPISAAIASVAAISGDVTIAADNIADIVAAPAAAASAAASALAADGSATAAAASALAADGSAVDAAASAAAATSDYTAPGTGAVTRTLPDKLEDVVSVSDYGTLQQALTYLNSNGGGTLWIPPGDITVTSSVTLSVAADITIVFAAGARVVAGAGLATPVFNFSDSVLQTHNVRFVSPKVDCSAGNSPDGGGAQYCSGIAVTNLKSLIVTDAILYGGTDPDNNNADSGITTVNCIKVHISGGSMQGWNDAAIYPGGDNTDGDGCICTVENVYFYRCKKAVAAKRDMDFMRFAYNEVTECRSGIQSNETTTPTPPPKRMDVIGNLFKKIEANVVRYSAQCSGRMTGNTIEDWGRTYDGVTDLGANGASTFIRGARQVEHENNTYRFREWTPVSQRAVLHDNITLDEVLYIHGSLRSTGNTYIGVPTVYASVTIGTPSLYLNEIFDGIGNIKTANFNSESLITYNTVGNPRMYSLIGGITYAEGPSLQVDTAVDVTLTIEDTGGFYGNGTSTGAGSTQFFLPTCQDGLEFTFIQVATKPILIRAATGDLIRLDTGSTTSGGYINSQTRFGLVTLRGISSTNWICLSRNGNWFIA